MTIGDNSALGSKDIARCAILMCLTKTHNEEKELAAKFAEDGVRAAAVDYGGEFITSVMKIIQRTVVASKREGVINDSHAEEGAVAGAAREAMSQVMNKAIGLNVGGKIGVARCGDHIAVAMLFGIGLLHLNEVAMGLGHRVV